MPRQKIWQSVSNIILWIVETTTTKYLPDTLHLNGSGYDILTPYVIEALEAVLDPSTAPADTTTAAPEGYDYGNHDFGGHEFKVLNFETYCSTYMTLDIDEQSGEALDDAVYARMSQLLEGVDGTTLQVDTRFSGSREDETLRGSITGISTRNFTPAELTYGFLEGMIGELYRLYQTMGVQRTGLIASGNGIRKNTALQKVAERYFGAKLRIPEHKEEAAYGAALFALIAGGFYESARDVQRLIRLKG